MSKVFEGVRIVDLGMAHAGIAAGYMMGDLGAEIIKVEDSVRGDSSRGWSSQFGAQMAVKGHSLNFENSNRNKKSLSLNLKKTEGKEILYQLVKKSDVFITNFHPIILAELGATYEILVKHNPRIIYSQTSAFGLKGPRKDVRRGFDLVGQAYGGIMWASGDRDADEPFWTVGGIIDQTTAVFAAWGIASALYHREVTGKGQQVETSLLGSAINMQPMAINAVGMGAGGFKRQARKRARNPLTNNYKCADGEWMLVAEPQSDRFWSEFCTVLGLKNLINDPQYSDYEKRSKNRIKLIEILDAAFASKTRAEWLKIFDGKGMSFAYSPINRWTDLFDDPQVLENQYIVPLNHPVLGDVKMAGFPVKFSNCPAEIQSSAPQFGQHTEEILVGLLGYSWEQIAHLKDEQVIA